MFLCSGLGTDSVPTLPFDSGCESSSKKESVRAIQDRHVGFLCSKSAFPATATLYNPSFVLVCFTVLWHCLGEYKNTTVMTN